MRLLRLLLLLSVQTLAISPFASNASLFDVLPSDSTISSNNANITSNNTQSVKALRVTCRVAEPLVRYAIEVAFCGPVFSIACRNLRAMADSHERRGSWNWVTLNPDRNCVAGFYVPLSALPWMFPSLEDCHSLIFEHILYVCSHDPRINVGAVNVDDLPTSFSPGTPMEQGYPRYLIAAKRL